MFQPSKEISEYIEANKAADTKALLLKKSPFPGVSMQMVAQQIKGRSLATKKFPFLLKEGIVFPPNINLEQSSSAAAADYKKSLVRGKIMVDLTAGFGIDSYFISQNFESAHLVEQDCKLLQIVEHNWQILDRQGHFINKNLEDFLAMNRTVFDLIFLDPARRDINRKKVFLLEDLSPNILEIQDQLLKTGRRIMVKLSPLIDINYLISVLKNISEIHIIAIKNDVKEILVLIEQNIPAQQVRIKCVNLETAEPAFQFFYEEETEKSTEYGEPEKYIYLPNNAVMKSGAFNLIPKMFTLKKLHPNTHIYTSAERKNNFPGRILEMKLTNSKELKSKLQYNIISKNYPLKPDEIKKKYKLIDGGKDYLIFTQSRRGKIILKSI